jgi:hypothetical protein
MNQEEDCEKENGTVLRLGFGFAGGNIRFAWLYKEKGGGSLKNRCFTQNGWRKLLGCCTDRV